jgi:hypothetical protein
MVLNGAVLSSEAGMSKASEIPRRWYQITMRGIFVATFFAALFCFGLIIFGKLWKHELVLLESETTAYFVIGCLLFASLPAAIGGLFGRALWGIAVGIVAFGLYVAWIFIAIGLAGGI